jgi:hypothetical protein
VSDLHNLPRASFAPGVSGQRQILPAQAARHTLHLLTHRHGPQLASGIDRQPVGGDVRQDGRRIDGKSATGCVRNLARTAKVRSVGN